MLINLYKKILKYIGLSYDDEGFIYLGLKDEKIQLSIDNKIVVLPTPEQLKSFNGEEKILFHPLAENILENGEPKLVKKLRECLNVRFNTITSEVSQKLLDIVLSPELHKKLDSSQMEILTVIKDADNKTLANFSGQLLTLAKKDIRSLFVNSYIKRGGMYRGKKYSRVAVTTFPFYEKIDEFKVRKKDKVVFKDLIRFIFPEVDDEEAYNYGSNSRVAPFLDALMMGSLKIAENLNDVVSVYAPYLEDYESLTFDSSWFEDFQDLESLVSEIRKIPAHPVINEPKPIPNQVNAQSNQPNTQYPNQPYLTPNQPVQNNQPVGNYLNQPEQPVTNNSGDDSNGIDYRELVKRNPALGLTPNAASGLLFEEAIKNQQYGQPYPQQPYGQPYPHHMQELQPLQPGSFPRP